MSNIFPEILAYEGHPVDAERAERRGAVEEPCDDLYICRIVGSIHRMWWAPPVYGMLGFSHV